MENIVPFTEFNAGNVKVNPKIRTLESGGKMVYLSYNDKPLVIQTPELVAPYGLSKWDNDGKSAAKYSLDLSFKGMDSKEHIAKFYKAMQEFDSSMVEQGLKHSEEWFKKSYKSKEVVEALYTCVLRRSKDDKYPPTLKMTVPVDMNTGDFKCKVFDKRPPHGNLDLNTINLKGAKVTAIVQCTGVWIAGTKFGTTWKVVQLRVEQVAKITEYAFQDIQGDTADDLDEDDDEHDGKVVVPAAAAKEKDDDDFVESEEEDEEDELEKKPVVVAKKGGKK